MMPIRVRFFGCSLWLAFICVFIRPALGEPGAQARKASVNPSESWKGEVRRALSEKNFSGAARTLQQFLAQHGDNYAFVNLLGTTLERAERHGEATGHYLQALSRNPGSDTVRLNLALNYVRRREFSKASEEFTRLLREDTGVPRAEALYQQSPDDGSIRAFMAAVPARERDWYELGMLLLRHRRILGAQALFEESIRLFPGSALLHHGLGRSLQEGGKFETARLAFSKALELEPTLAEAAIRLGYAHFVQGEYEPAVRFYRKALETAPGSYEGHYFLGQALARTSPEEVEPAIRHLERAVELHPGSADSRIELGKIYLKVGNPADARAELEAADRLSPGNEQIQYLLAGIYEAAGERALAKKALAEFEAAKRRERERARELMESDLLGGGEPPAAAFAEKTLRFIESYTSAVLDGNFSWVWERLTEPSRRLYDNDFERFAGIASKVFGQAEVRARIQKSRLAGGKRVAGRVLCEFTTEGAQRVPPLALLDTEDGYKVDYSFDWTTAGLGYLGAR